MIGPFVIHILIGWPFDGARIPLTSFSLNKNNLCENYIIFIGVEDFWSHHLLLLLKYINLPTICLLA